MRQHREGTDDTWFTRLGCLAGLLVALVLPLWGFVLYFASAFFG
ncbi:hypothetical protein [Streptomyces oceani]|nr:hypothetical protein [Streptomyces oceani]